MSISGRAEICGAEGLDLPPDLTPALNGLLAYWLGMPRDGGRLPRKKRFDPLDLPGLWHGLVLMEFCGDPDWLDDLVIRYSGEWVDARHGCSMVGERLSSLVDEAEFHRSMPDLRLAAQNGAPHYSSGQHEHRKRGLVSYERLVAPFADEAGEPAYLVGMWHWPSHRTGGADGDLHHVSSRKPASVKS